MKRIVAFGEIMWRLSAPTGERLEEARTLRATWGGAEANVVASLARFGCRGCLVTRLPRNPLAEGCVGELRRAGVEAEALVGEGRMGVYYVEWGSAVRPASVLYDRAGSSFAGIDAGMVEWERILNGADWFHVTGITPALSPGAAAACREGVEVARRLGIPISIDLNYRARLWQWGGTPLEVMSPLVAQCDVLIGNEEDADRYFGIRCADFDAARSGGRIEGGAYEEVARGLHERFPQLRAVALTLRGSVSADHNTWGACLWDGVKLALSRRYTLTPIVDRMGGGDAFAAGLIYGLLHWSEDRTRALEFATAASALKHTFYGDFNRVSVAEVERLMSGDTAGRVQR